MREFSLEYDFDEYVDACLAHWKARKSPAGLIAIFIVLFAIGFFAVMALKPLPGLSDTLKFGLGTVAGLALASLATWMPRSVQRWSVRPQLRRHYHQLRNDERVTRYRFDDDHLEIEDHIAGGNVKWSEIHEWWEDDEFVLIYRTDHFFYYIPKAKVDTATLDALKACLTSASVKKR